MSVSHSLEASPGDGTDAVGGDEDVGGATVEDLHFEGKSELVVLVVV